MDPERPIDFAQIELLLKPVENRLVNFLLFSPLLHQHMIRLDLV
jgi:hypothetical protein